MVGRPGSDAPGSSAAGRCGTAPVDQPGGEYGGILVWAATGPAAATARTTAGRLRVIVMRPSPGRPPEGAAAATRSAPSIRHRWIGNAARQTLTAAAVVTD
jgi:hypothetical protein